MNYTVTVGIPAYNEEENIGQLIQSILDQNKKSYILEKIIVVNDGSSDRTSQIVEELSKKNPLLTYMNDNERKSKCYRLNQLYEINTSDILITFDGDVGFYNKNVIDNMVACFDDENVSLVAASDKPTPPVTFQQRVINSWYQVWTDIRTDYKNGSNVYNLHGNGTALRKSLAKSIRYPIGITADQDFLYLSTVQKKVKFAYAKNAIILFHTPEFFSEFFSQTTRFLTEKKVLDEIFGSWITAEYYIPRGYKLKSILKTFFYDPIYTTFAFMMYFALIFSMKESDPLLKKGMWQQARTTKRAIKI